MSPPEKPGPACLQVQNCEACVPDLHVSRPARTIKAAEGPDEYRLALVLQDGRKIALAEVTRENEVAGAAEEMASLLGIKVVRK